MQPFLLGSIPLEPQDRFLLLRFIPQHLRFASIITVKTTPNYLAFARILDSVRRSSIHPPPHRLSLGRVTRQVPLGSLNAALQPYDPHFRFYCGYGKGSHVCSSICCATVASWWNYPFPSHPLESFCL